MYSFALARPQTGRDVPASQAKPSVGPADDPLEREADQAADRIVAGEFAGPVGTTSSSAVRRKCAECEAEDDKHIQLKQRSAPRSSNTSGKGHAAVNALSSGGVPLSAGERAYFEPRFHHDLSNVRFHTHPRAAAAADGIRARAYTWRNDIAFAPGEFSPGSLEGRRLIAHELTHVIQQNSSRTPSIQRDEKKGQEPAQQPAPQAAPAQQEAGSAYYHIVVRDKDLDLGGGVLVDDLAAAKKTLLKRKVDKPWTLVLSIHASENRLGAQSGPNWQDRAVFYDEAAIKALFGGDNAFVAWRNQFGPSQVVLYGCQVTAAFEQTITDNLTRGGKASAAHGLGEGCKPQSTRVTFGVETRAAYDALAEDEKAKMLGEVQKTNDTWGYYGGPPVPRDKVIDYLFKGPMPGWWPKVEVIVKTGDKYLPTNPPIPYWNRLSSSQYLQHCTHAVGNLREHKPSAPTMREEE
jgi:hypothetical protein